jgi:hypothetical protein
MKRSGTPAQLPPEMPRHDPEIGRLEAERILSQTLSKAAHLFNKGGPASRDGMMLALDVVCSFLRARGLSGQQIQPLIALMQELDHIWAGKRSLLLQPGSYGPDNFAAKSRAIGPGKRSIKLYAAACAEAVYQLGRDPEIAGFQKLTRTQADTQVARAMRNWPAFDQQAVTGRTVKGWRDEITSTDRQDVRYGQWEKVVSDFISSKRGRVYLGEALRKGPPLTGGFPE